MSNIATSGTLINLWCIVRENRSIFKITIGLGNDLDDLRKVIKEERKPRFNDFAPDELVLWRVNVASNILGNKEIAIEPYLNEKLEDPADTVENTFQYVVGNNIRVIVDVPEQPVAETSRNERIQDKDLDIYWDVIKNLKIANNESFLDLPKDVHILGDPDKPSTLFIRKCYQDLGTVVLNDNVRRIRITGNPGIGKTYFGYYLLYLLAQQGKTILYESVSKESSYIFDGEATFHTFDKIIINTYKSKKDVCYIVDGMEPKEVKAKTILICSPKKSHYANFDKYSLVTIRYMPVWSLNEICTCRTEMFNNIDQDKVNKLFSMWGGIPRFVLEQADEYVQQQKLLNAIELCGDQIFNYIGSRDASPEISHALIHLWTNLPTEEYENNADEESDDVKITYIEEIPYTKQLYYFASDYVASLVTGKCKQDILGKLLRDLEVNLSTGTSDQFLGTCFEQIAHRILRKGGEFNVRSLESDDHAHNAKTVQLFNKQENILTFSEIKDIENGKYYQPEIKNFPTIDAICTPDILLQMTTSMTHPIEMVGLNKVYDKLAKNREIAFYFVVPAKLYDLYQKQGFVTTKKNNVQRLPTWIRQHVKQYALRIDLSGFSAADSNSSHAISNKVEAETITRFSESASRTNILTRFSESAPRTNILKRPLAEGSSSSSVKSKSVESDDEGDPCPYCESTFTKVEDLVKHIRKNHM